MGKLLLSIIAGVCLVAVSFVVVYLRRSQKEKLLSDNIVRWSANMAEVHPEDTLLVVVYFDRHQSRSDTLCFMENLFISSFCPSRITVIIANPHGSADTLSFLFPNGESDRESYPVTSRFSHKIKINGIPSNVGRPMCMLKAFEEQGNKENFVLFAHDACEFLLNWDSTCLEEFKRCPDKDSILTTFPGRSNQKTTMYFPIMRGLDSHGLPVLGKREFKRMGDISTRHCLYINPDFMFGKREIIEKLLSLSCQTYLSYNNWSLLLTTAALMNGNKWSLIPKTIAYRNDWKHIHDPQEIWKRRLGTFTTLSLLCSLLACEKVNKWLKTPNILNLPPKELSHSLQVMSSSPKILPLFELSEIFPDIQNVYKFVNARKHIIPEAENYFAKRLEISLNFKQKKKSMCASQGMTKFTLWLFNCVKTVAKHKNFETHVRTGSHNWVTLLKGCMELHASWLVRSVDDLKSHNHMSFSDVQNELGLDFQGENFVGTAALGISGITTPCRVEITEKFGSQQALDREKSQWYFVRN